jgi:hypothetical protein
VFSVIRSLLIVTEPEMASNYAYIGLTRQCCDPAAPREITTGRWTSRILPSPNAARGSRLLLSSQARGGYSRNILVGGAAMGGAVTTFPARMLISMRPALKGYS